MLKNHCLILTLLLLSSVLYGQTETPTGYPALIPSNITAFDIDDGLPVSCTYSSFVDDAGRIWINPCFFQEEHRSIDVYQFDGLESHAITWENIPPEIEGQAAVFGQNEAGHFIGFFRRSPYFFTFDPESHQAAYFSIPDSSGAIWNMSVNSKKEVIIYGVEEGLHLIYLWKGGDLKELARLPRRTWYRDEMFIPSMQLITDNHFWFFDYYSTDPDSIAPGDFADQLGAMVKIDLKTGLVDEYKISDIYGGKVPLPNWLVYPVRVEERANGEIHFFFAAWLQHFKWIPETDTFQKYKVFPSLYPENILFSNSHFLIQSDAVGNLLYYYQNAAKEYVAILVDPEGKSYDYSQVLNRAVDQSRFVNGFVKYLQAKDFRKKVYICTEGGIIAVNLKFYQSIVIASENKPTRAITELGPDHYFLIREGGGGHATVKLNRRTGRVELTTQFLFNCQGQEVHPRSFYTNLIRDEEGNIWFSWEKQLVKIAPNLDCTFFPVGVSFSKFIFLNDHQVFIEDDGSLYIHDLESEKTVPFISNSQHLKIRGRINQIYLADDFTVWIASLKGLWKIDIQSGDSQRIGLDEGFQDERIMCIHEDERRRLWLGTYSAGLQIFDPKTRDVKLIDKKDGLSNNTVIGILTDDEGIRWVSTYQGLSLLDKSGNVLSQLFKEDGLSTDEFNRYSYYKDSKGKLLFGSIAGVNIIDPVSLKAQLFDTEDLKIYLSGISYFDPSRSAEFTRHNKFNQLETIELPATHRYLRLKFALSSLIRLEDNQYSYRIVPKKGVSKGQGNWIFIGSNPELILNNLPPGAFTIEVMGIDHRGNKTLEPLKIEVYVNDFFYNKWGFYFILLLIILGGFMAWQYRQRITRLKLEKQVEERTQEIMKTRDQLLVQEKLASLGQLTAGIAHEIKNPLNFVNNFAEGSLEMLDELKEEIDAIQSTIPQQQYLAITELIDELKENAKDIYGNGKRADRIVRSMMDHASGSESEMQKMQVNDLIEENLNLAYHSYRAMDSTFNIEIKKDFDPNLPLVNLYPQEFGRVLLNIMNNAFYAVNEKRKTTTSTYFPELIVETKIVDDKVQILIRDNGPGIPKSIQQKIFTPFFTTKSTGDGNSGLGLSISYDIIVQQHGGTLQVESKKGEYTSFIIQIK